jgi:broad specificity phosphatase PhoE
VSARVLLVRHGSTALNAKGTGTSADASGRVKGWLDVPLDEDGKREAERIALRLRDANVKVIYSSDLQRALDTAGEIKRRTGALGPIPTPELKPWNLGQLQNRRITAVSPEMARLVRHEEESPRKGEPFRTFRRRFLACLQRLLMEARRTDSVICAVTHTRNVQLARAWETRGCPDDLSIDPQTMNDYSNETDPGEVATLVPGERGCRMVKAA